MNYKKFNETVKGGTIFGNLMRNVKTQLSPEILTSCLNVVLSYFWHAVVILFYPLIVRGTI